MSIIAKDLTKTFDGGKSFALDKVNVEIKQGEFICIIGLSGAGKSTFLRSINGTCLPSSGGINVLGKDVQGLRGKGLVELRKRVGFIFQQFNLVKSVSVLNNVMVGRVGYTPLWRTLTGLYTRPEKALAIKTLDSVGLKGRYYDKARNLSGGQQQRVAIARALVQEPKIILADEPMASLDPKLSEVVLEILTQVNREQGITVLVNIHVLEYARKYAKRIIGFRRGKLVFDGHPSELTEELLTDIYDVDGTSTPNPQGLKREVAKAVQTLGAIASTGATTL